MIFLSRLRTVSQSSLLTSPGPPLLECFSLVEAFFQTSNRACFQNGEQKLITDPLPPEQSTSNGNSLSRVKLSNPFSEHETVISFFERPFAVGKEFI